MRPTTREEMLLLKSAFHRSCEDIGDLKWISDHTRVDTALLSRYGNPERPEFPPVDVMLDVDRLSGGDRCFRALAEILGYTVERDEKGIAIEAMHRHIGQCGREFGEAISGMCEAQADGKTSPREALKVERELDDAIEAAQVARADMRRIRANNCQD